jgi:hypothetical protein
MWIDPGRMPTTNQIAQEIPMKISETVAKILFFSDRLNQFSRRCSAYIKSITTTWIGKNTIISFNPPNITVRAVTKITKTNALGKKFVTCIVTVFVNITNHWHELSETSTTIAQRYQ